MIGEGIKVPQNVSSIVDAIIQIPCFDSQGEVSDIFFELNESKVTVRSVLSIEATIY
jgi:hypothetical protein